MGIYEFEPLNPSCQYRFLQISQELRKKQTIICSARANSRKKHTPPYEFIYEFLEKNRISHDC